MDKKTLTPVVLAIIATAVIFLFPWSFSTMVGHCLCGGCCVGCPGDCEFTMGTPITYYYAGVNGLSGEVVNQFSFSGFITDAILWGILMFLLYRFVCRKR
jgi:hypothetical protein